MAIITTDSQHYTNIAKTIREATNTEDEFYPYEMAEKVEEVAVAAKNEGIRAMWEALQMGGSRVDYSYAFYTTEFTSETLKPIYDIIPINANDMFNNCPLVDFRKDGINYGFVMKDIEEKCGIVFDFSNCTNFTRAFAGGLFKEYNVIDLSSVAVASRTTLMFYGGYLSKLEMRPTKIERLIFADKTQINSDAFNYANMFTYIGFEGTIATNLNLSACTKLVPESMKKAILCLKNYSGTSDEFTKTIKFAESCWTNLEADSVAPDGGTWSMYVSNLGWNT